MMIEIIEWDKYNPRKDVNRSSWFRMEHCLFELPSFFSFNHEEKLTWIYLLCCASKVGNKTVEINQEHAYKIAGFENKTLKLTLKKLEQVGVIKVVSSLRTRNVDVTPTCPTYERTNVRTNEKLCEHCVRF